MAVDRRERIWALLAGDGNDAAIESTALPERICAVCVRVVAVTGAGVTVMTSAGQRGMVHGTDPVARLLEEVQLTLGEGPCVDAFTDRGPVLSADVSVETRRWPTFAGQAVAAGVSAVFSFPLQVGAARLGVLDLYRTSTGALSSEELADALVFADLATQALLIAAPGQPGGVQLASLDGVDTHPELHQASGMVMVQLGITAADALVRLRAYAYAHDLQVSDVSRQVIARQLRLEGDSA